MIDPTNLHLTDDALNEYLDAALAPSALASADAHLAGCGACRARLDDLRALFASLDALPETPLMRDLAPAVVQAVRPHLAPVKPARRPWLTLVTVAQVIVSLAALALAWPFAAARLGTLAESTVPTSAWWSDLVASLLALANALPPPGQLWAAFEQSATAGWAGVFGNVTATLPVQLLVSLAAVASLLWLLTNVWVWRQRPNDQLRRTP